MDVSLKANLPCCKKLACQGLTRLATLLPYWVCIPFPCRRTLPATGLFIMTCWLPDAAVRARMAAFLPSLPSMTTGRFCLNTFGHMLMLEVDCPCMMSKQGSTFVRWPKEQACQQANDIHALSNMDTTFTVASLHVKFGGFLLYTQCFGW